MSFFYAFYMIKIDYVYGSNIEILLIFYSFHRYFANKILMDNRNLKFRENSDILRFHESQRPNPAYLDESKLRTALPPITQVWRRELYAGKRPLLYMTSQTLTRLRIETINARA